MDKVKNKLATLTIATIVAGGSLGFSTDAHAVGVASWSFTQWFTSSSSGAPSLVSNTWTSSSSNNTVAISGWQTTGQSPSANLDYEVVEKQWNGYKSNWVLWNNPYNYSSSSFYDHRFDGIPNGKTIAIRVTVKQGYPADGAGNAYQSN